MNKIIKPTHKRISPEEGLDLFCNAETAELMSMADKARREINKTKTYFTHSLNINPTNICENRCPLCAFWREKNAGDAYFYSIDKISERIKAVQNWDLTDLHIVGGLTQEIDLDYFEKMFRTAKELLPETLIQGLTAVEILFLAEKEGLPLKNVLQRLKDAGLGAIPGGGAEIFAPRVRNIICPEKISADQWLNIHGNAHEIGLHTNATMLFGHIKLLKKSLTTYSGSESNRTKQVVFLLLFLSHFTRRERNCKSVVDQVDTKLHGQLLSHAFSWTTFLTYGFLRIISIENSFRS